MVLMLLFVLLLTFKFMKKYFYILSFVLFASCTDQDLQGYYADSFLYSLETSNADIVTDPLEKELSIQITSNVAWTAETSDSWILLKKTMGEGNETIPIGIKDNLNNSDRIGTIKLFQNGKFKKSIKIVQKASTLSLSSDSIKIGPKGGIIGVNVVCNGKWQVENRNSWISTSALSGEKNGTLELTIAEHPSTDGRLTSLLVYDQAGNKKELVFVQDGCKLEFNKKEVFLLKTGTSISIDYVSNWDVDIIVPNNNWLNTTITNSKMSFEANNNQTGDRRWIEVIVQYKKINKNIDTIFVNQGFIDEPEYVQINETKFATCNLGAASPEETGLMYSYADTFVGEDLWPTWVELSPGVYTSYHPNIAGTKHDIVCLTIGGNWKLDSDSHPDFYNLIQWDFVRTTQNGVPGWLFENKLFIPNGDYYGKYYADGCTCGTQYWASHFYYTSWKMMVRPILDE